MLQAPVVKFAPELRVAISGELFRLLGCRSLPSHSTSNDLLGSRLRVLRSINDARRLYATVHADETTKLWNQHGKDLSATASGEPELNEEGSANQQDGSSRGSLQRAQVVALAKRMASKSPPAYRSRVRARLLHTALKSEDPLLTLRNHSDVSSNAWIDDMPRAQSDRPETTQVKQPSQDAVIPPNNGETPKTSGKASEDASHEAPDFQVDEKKRIQLLDLKYVQEHKPLPTEAAYPQALPELFDPVKAPMAIANICQKLKLSFDTEVNFAPKEGLVKEALRRTFPGKQQIFVCNLKLKIADVCHESADGEDDRKQTAKQAAWLHLISRLHVSGTLRELFPSPESLHSSDQLEKDVPGIPIETIKVDKQTLQYEKDALTEIYNFVASLGSVPEVETKSIQPRTPRARFGRTPKKPQLVYQVNIRLESQGIDVNASNQSRTTAEIAAAVAFKQQAEDKHRSAYGLQTTPFAVLNTDTARDFLEFYKSREEGINLELEHEIIAAGKQRSSAKLTVNGTQIGRTAVMRTKSQAESIAYLTAAVEIAQGNTKLLDEFAIKINKGKGKILRTVSSVDLEVGSEALQSMRHALVEARNSGLPDTRQTLTAETSDPYEHLSHRRYRLSSYAQKAAKERLLAHQKSLGEDSTLAEMRSKRTALPMSSYRAEVLQMINDNQYGIVIGATGSGKTTQVPQIVFENAINEGHGSRCNVVCTQPRRIAATSVAQRVAVERNESLRKTVGYHVRFDAKLPYEPYGITYCTTGILLEKLKHDADSVLDSASHIVVDEVHERDLSIDFLMILLKRAISKRQAEGRSVPKVVLMSATLDTELFAAYFGKVDSEGNSQHCPVLHVPGRTFPVREKHLGSIMYDLFAQHGAESKTLLGEDAKTSEYLKVETAFSESREDPTSRPGGESLIDWKRERQQSSASEEDVSVLREKEDALVPTSLVATVVAHICKTTSKGAILAFLPGLEEIVEVQKLLEGRSPLGVDFTDQSKYQICLLHSTVPKEQQAEIFQASPSGCRKIILSTNIAETSITVPEVKYVVDTGKLREKRYDQLRRITKLQCVWESKSNSKQRAGRAGRVEDGFYYALFSKERGASLRAVGLPELLRSDLQDICLSIKAQNFDEPISSFLAQAIEPPSKQAVDAAIQNLVSIEAFTAGEDLTALGRVLSQLPVHPTLSKMIILGVIFRCLDPMIIIGAAAEERSLFVSPLGARREAQQAHRGYGGESQSDHIALLNAFEELRSLKNEAGNNAASQRARERFLHMGAFRVIDQTSNQIAEILAQSGLIASDQSKGSGYGPVELNSNSKNHALVRALLLAGFHPNLAVKTHSLLYRTPTEQAVLMQPSSLNTEVKKANTKHAPGTLFAYSTLAKSVDGSTLFLRDSTRISPLMAVLFGGQLKMVGDGRLEMDEWLPFFVKAQQDRQFSTRMVLEFRKALDRVLNGAFSSLSNLKGEGRTSGIGLGADPMRERFAQRVVDILQGFSGEQVQHVWP